jgi:hypothetical protein
MTQNNIVSLNIPAADLKEIQASIKTLQAKLLPHLVTLSPDDRHEMAKMGAKTVNFVQKSLEYCGQNPDLVPPFLDVNELTIDTRAVELLRSLYQPLLQITEGVSDTMTLSGSEAYSAALLFYTSVKSAAKAKIQKAETIYNDLSARFPGRGRKSAPVVTAESNS